MAKAKTSTSAPQFRTEGLLVQIKDKVYFIEMHALNNYVVRVSAAQQSAIASFFKEVDKKYLVDAAKVPALHIFEGAG